MRLSESVAASALLVRVQQERRWSIPVACFVSCHSVNCAGWRLFQSDHSGFVWLVDSCVADVKVVVVFWRTFAVFAAFAFASVCARNSETKALAITFNATWLLASAALAMLELLSQIHVRVNFVEVKVVGWHLRWIETLWFEFIESFLELLLLYQFTSESRRIPLKNVKLRLLNQVRVLLLVTAPIAVAFRATVNSFRKALAIQLQAPWFAARTLGSCYASSQLLVKQWHWGRRWLQSISVRKKRLSSILLRRLIDIVVNASHSLVGYFSVQSGLVLT